jgi:hypothetical protein
MKTQLVPAGRGARWLGEGWRLFRAAPFAWLTVAFVFYMVLVIASKVPAVGASLFSLLVPALWMAFMAVARSAASGRRESPAAFFAGLAANAVSLGVLGIVYLAGNVLAIAATIPFSDGHLARWVFRGAAPEREVIASGEFLSELALSMVFYSPVLLAFFYAPMLTAWHRFGAVKALFFSLAACLINWRPFLAYGMVVAAALGVLVMLASVVVGLLASGGRAGLNVALIVLVPMFAVFFCALAASAYASYRDIFAEGPAQA